jgi:hypothetical protein
VICFGCKRSASRYVYMENGHDYCLDCARRLYLDYGIRPAGKREDDITLEEFSTRAGPEQAPR